MHNLCFVYSDSHEQEARDIAQRWQLTYTNDKPDTGMGLVFDGQQLALFDFEDTKSNGVVVDFLSGESQYRKQHGGGKKEPIAKAIGLKGEKVPSVLDATPGLGRDAFVLAALGCQVHLVERSPVVAALLEDGIRRLTLSNPDLGQKFVLHHGDSKVVMTSWKNEQIDAVYLDPMFPHKKKSALVKKEMRLFQQLLGHDTDADELLGPALALAQQRVVVKRPNSADVLAGKQPTMAITSKKHRFDVYINH